MDQVSFLKAAIAARTLQLYYHYCHNLVTGPSFTQDHAEFAAYYAQAALDYDVIIEYMIANLGNKALDTQAVNEVLFKRLSTIKVEVMSAEEMFEIALELESEYQQALENLEDKGSIGLKNALGAIAEFSDVRKYKIQQRLK